MKNMIKIIAILLMAATISSFAACDNKDDVKTEGGENGVVTEEPADEKAEESVYGTWIVEKNEAFEGPMKAEAQRLLDEYYAIGSEHIFMEDGTFKSADGKISSTFEVVSDKLLRCVAMNTGEAILYDYELNGDEFILYGNYNGNLAHLGHSNVVYFKRK